MDLQTSEHRPDAWRTSILRAAGVGIVVVLALFVLSVQGGSQHSRAEPFEVAEMLVQSSGTSPYFDEEQQQHAVEQDFRAVEAKWPNAFDKFVVVDNPSSILASESFADLARKRPLPSNTDSSKPRMTNLASAYDRCAPNQPFEVNTDYQGSDLMTGITNIASALDCCYRCVETANCRYFTYGTDQNKCWVKDSATGHESQLYRTSGDLLQYTDPPTEAPTVTPTSTPTEHPTMVPTADPAAPPTHAPTTAPSTAATPPAPVTVPTVQAPAATKTVYVTHNELKLALHLLTHNLLHYIQIRLQGLGDDMQPQLHDLKKQLRIYIDKEIQMILSTTMHGSLHDLKAHLMNDLTSKIGSYVNSIGGSSHVHLGSIGHTLGTHSHATHSVSVRELPHAQPTYKDQERLRGLRHSAQYMINSAGTSDKSQDPLAKYGAEAMIPTHIVEHKHVKRTSGFAPDSCDPLAGWKFGMC
jgi:hypothetical protein